MEQQPRYTKKLIWCIVLVGLLQVLKKYFDASHPGSILFHHYLLTGLQLIVLLWTIISLLLPSMSVLMKTILLVIIFSLPELLFTYWIKNPRSVPASARPLLNTYCTQAETHIVQYMAQGSEYNNDLFYTLKPLTRFLFSNPEFSDSFYTNKMGLRDDEFSLQRPSVICLGDSYAMGWGVAQPESFPEQLEKMLHEKVLNAAISSYGTVRELKNLYRLDTSALQTIIIQYCRNDYRENNEYVTHNYSLPVSSRARYDSLLEDHYWSTLWYPGKRVFTLTKMYSEQRLNPILFPQRITWKDSAAFHLNKAARYFIEILYRSSINFNKVTVLVVDMNEQQTMNNDFIDAVNELIQLPQYTGHFNKHLIMVPVAGLLTNEDFYILDPHIKASGHRKIAERLFRYMAHKQP